MNTANNAIAVKIGDETVSIRIKYSLSFTEMAQFVNNIVTSVFDENDDTYMPELFDFAVRRNVVAAYTDFQFPEDIDAIYEVLYGSQLYNYLVNVPSVYDANEHSIDIDQFNAAVEAAQRKADHLVAQSLKKSKADELFEALTQVVNNLSDTISTVDIPLLIDALGSLSKIDAESVVKAMVGDNSANG